MKNTLKKIVGSAFTSTVGAAFLPPRGKFIRPSRGGRNAAPTALLLALTFGLAGAANAAHVHCVCGDGACSVPEHAHASVTWTEWTATDSLPSTAGNWYLANDVTLSAAYTPVSGVNLCLNGHMVKQTKSDQRVISIYNGRTVTITDCCGGEASTERKWTTADVTIDKWTYEDAIWVLTPSATGTPGVDYLTTTGGVITGGAITGGAGAGVWVTGGTLNFYGGTVVGNQDTAQSNFADSGGGIQASSGTLSIYGGRFCGNCAWRGGGVAVKTSAVTFKMLGGLVDGNDGCAGGGFYFYEPSGTSSYGANPALVSNVVVSGNKVFKDGFGSAIAFMEAASWARLDDVTAVGNDSTLANSTLIRIAGKMELLNCCLTGNRGSNAALVMTDGSKRPGELIVGGTTVVDNNLSGSTEVNIRLNAGKTMSISTEVPLAPGADIGVTTATTPTAAAPVAITSNGAATDAQYFTSDKPNYGSRFSVDHVALYAKANVTPTTVSHTSYKVYTNGTEVVKSGSAYVVWGGDTVDVVYTVTDDSYAFSNGETTWTSTFVADGTSGTPEAVRPSAPVQVWFDEASLRYDTSYTTNECGNAIFVVTHPDQVLPVAYSTNNWGTATNAAGMVVGTQVSLLYQGPTYGPTTFITESVTNGLYNWTPTEGDYGRHNFGARSVSADGTITNWLDGTILYTTNFNLTVKEPAEGGTIAAYTNAIDAAASVGNDSWPLALVDEVKLVTTPASPLWWVEWVATNGAATRGCISPKCTTNSFTMPLCDVAVTAQFRYVGVELQSNAVDHASAKFYTNGVEVAATGDKSIVVTNTPAVVVYTADNGWFFEHGITAITNTLDTTKNPATGDSPAAPMEPVAYRWPEYKGGIATNGIAAWHTSTVTNFTVVRSAASRVTWNAGWYVVVGDDIRIDGGVQCAGNVRLILCDGAELTVTNVANNYAGIQTDASGSFTIYETAPVNATPSSRQIGELVVTMSGSYYGAGIGGGSYGVGLGITVNGGRVTAIGGWGSSGIGGGYTGAASDIAINAGTVTATGGSQGAGIGGGSDCPGENVTINGGVVRATGGDSGAGIGGSYKGDGSGFVINGGTVTATGGIFGAGIGGGYHGAGSNITINAGTVTATGGKNSAGIGGGSVRDASNITVNGGMVTATGSSGGAGIGGGQMGKGSRISIRAGTVFVLTQDTGSSTDLPAFIGDGCDRHVDLGTDNSVSPEANVFFNLTGRYDAKNSEWVEGVAPMSETFEGFVVMTPGTQTVDRVLVGGVGASGLPGGQPLPFALTNAVTGATSNITVNAAEHTDFANVFLRLTDADGNLTLKLDDPEFEITQQPEVANLYTIKATTDGSDGITNYCWCSQSLFILDFHSLTNSMSDQSVHGGIDGSSINSYAYYDEHVVMLLWMGALPDSGVFGFEGPDTLATDDTYGNLTKGAGNTWTYEPTPMGGYHLLVLATQDNQPFAITNLTYMKASYTPVIEGATLTTFPAEKGEVGSNYLCRVTYGHHGAYYTADSEMFEFHYPIVAEPTPIDHTTWTVYTNGAASAEVEVGKWAAWSNETAVVVYTADSGYTFPGGATVVTNKLDTLKNPATNLGEDPFPVSRDVVVASNMGENPCFSEVETNELGEVASFVFEGKDYFVGLNAFPSFAEAFTNETFVPFATNLHVFGYQTITEDAPMVYAWTFDFVTYTDATGATNAPSVSIATVDDGIQAYSQTLVNITNTLDKIVGDGVIVLSVTNGTPGAATYKQDLENLIGGENVVVLYTNFEPAREEDISPETGNPVVNETLVVDDKSKVEEDGTIVLPGLDTSGKATVEVKDGTTNDVVVAGKLVSREWDVVIVNETTNTLTVGAVETGMNVLITNVQTVGTILTLENVIAGKKIKIDNNGHLEATAHATDSMEIRNTAINTLVGEYKSGAKIDITGEYGSLSNVVVDAAGTLTLTGTNVVSGPVTFKFDSLDNQSVEFDWSVAGDNHTTMIDWDWVKTSTAFGVLVDFDQTDGNVVGTYVLASNLTASVAGTAFALKDLAHLEGGMVPPNTELTVGSDAASTAKTFIGNKAYRMYLVGDELVFEITWGKFNATFNYYEPLFQGVHDEPPARTTIVYTVDAGLTLPTDFVGEDYNLYDAWEGVAHRTFVGWSATNEWTDLYGDSITWGEGDDYQNGRAIGYVPTGLVTNIAQLAAPGDKEYWARWTYVNTWSVGADADNVVTATLDEATCELVLSADAPAAMKDGTYPGDTWEEFAADTVYPWYNNFRSLIHTLRVSAKVTHIGDYAFCDCASLEEIFFEGGVPTCGTGAFENCDIAVGYYSTNETSWASAISGGKFYGLTMYAVEDVPTCAGDGWYVRMTIDGRAMLTVAPGITEVTVTSNPKGYLIVAPNGVTVKNAVSVPQGRVEVKITGIEVYGSTVTFTVSGTPAAVVIEGKVNLGDAAWTALPQNEMVITSGATETTVSVPAGQYRFFRASAMP